jgi:hypothetical protein
MLSIYGDDYDLLNIGSCVSPRYHLVSLHHISPQTIPDKILKEQAPITNQQPTTPYLQKHYSLPATRFRVSTLSTLHQ